MARCVNCALTAAAYRHGEQADSKQQARRRLWHKREGSSEEVAMIVLIERIPRNTTVCIARREVTRDIAAVAIERVVLAKHVTDFLGIPDAGRTVAVQEHIPVHFERNRATSRAAQD